MGLMVELSTSAGPALVVGGGTVARRKVRGLLDAGFAVVVVAPAIDQGIRVWDGVTCKEREFEAMDLDGVAIAFACTDARAVNRAVGEAARARGILVNVADRRGESTFSSAALHRDGDLLIGVTTGGASPGLAVEVRDRIAEGLGAGWANAVRDAQAQRQARLRLTRDAE